MRFDNRQDPARAAAEDRLTGEIEALDEIVRRHVPFWDEAVGDGQDGFIRSRRLQAAAIGRHLTAGAAGRPFIDEYVSVPGREIPVRVYPALRPGPATLYVHGGGWVSGTLDSHHGCCELLREELGGAVLSVHTRRAPENRHPAQVEDVLEALRYLDGPNGLLRIGPEGLLLAGDSAGGFTVFRAALQLAARADLRGLLLFYPALDPDVGKASYRLHAESPGLKARTMERYWEALIGPDAGLRASLSLNAAAELESLPPVGVLVAEHDPLRGDGEMLAAMLAATGAGPVSILARGATHGFCRLVRHDPAARDWVVALLDGFRRRTAPRHNTQDPPSA